MSVTDYVQSLIGTQYIGLALVWSVVFFAIYRIVALFDNIIAQLLASIFLALFVGAAILTFINTAMLFS